MNTFLRIAMRRAGALALAAVLPLLLCTPAAWADTIYEVDDQSQSGCVPQFETAFVMSIPDMPFRGKFTGARSLQENVVGITNFSAEVGDAASGIAFEVEVRMSDKESCVVPTIPSPGSCETPSDYQCYSSWSGTLEIVADPTVSGNIGAVFSLTGTSELIFGDGAYIFSTLLGMRGIFSAQLDDPASFPDLPADPLTGDLRFRIKTAKAGVPGADASVVGTWDGTLDCIGQQGQTTELFSTSDTSTAATLLMALKGAKLGENTYCVNLPASPDSTSAEGQLASPMTVEFIEGVRLLLSLASHDPQGYVKYDGTTLKLRLLRSEGQLDNIDFCKGEFTRTSPTHSSFVVSGECESVTTGIFYKSVKLTQEFCDTVICGPGTLCENASSFGDGGHGSPVICLFL